MVRATWFLVRRGLNPKGMDEMSERIIDLEFGPYATEHGCYIVATVMDDEGNVYTDEVYYEDMQDCYEDIADLLEFGIIELEDDELEEDEDNE